jgi:hypothetical protein
MVDSATTDSLATVSMHQRYIGNCRKARVQSRAGPAGQGDLLQRASELALLAGGHWLGGGKWLSRRLAAADPGLHGGLTAGAVAALTGEADGPERLAAAVEEVLDRVGGPLWVGYTRG